MYNYCNINFWIRYIYTKLYKKSSERDNKWRDMHKKMAYYIEHDELEKVDTAIVKMKSYIENNEITLSIAELEEAKFVLEHIQEKNSFNLQNIF